MLQRWLLIATLLLALGATAVRVGPAAGRIVAPPGADQPIADTLPARAILEGYPQLYQQHRLSCEAASVSMATGGLIGEGTIVAAMPTSSDPWLGFRGTVDRHATLADGLANYGIYAPPLAREMQDFGYQTTVISGTEAPALLRYSIGELQLPVVTWVTYGLHDEPAIVGQAGAQSFPLVLHEHARLIVGYDAGGVYSHDPIDGPRYDPWPAFLHAWGTFDHMGLIVAPAFPRHDPPALAVQLAEHAVTWSWPQPAWPLADEVTISQAGQPLHRFLLAPAAQGANDLGQGIFSGASSDSTEGLSVPLGNALTALPLDPSLPVRPYLPVDALLGGPHARPGTAALTLRLAPGTPYTITVAAVDPLGVIYPAVTSPEVVDIPSTSPPGTPLFPPASFFVLPPDIAAGHTVVVPLRPEDIGSPSKPLTRLEYDIGSGSRGYRVDLFASIADASVSFAWQLAHPQAKLRLLPAAASLPGFRLYTIPGYAVATVLYRNIEFAASVPTRAGTVAASAADALALAQALVSRSSGYTGKGTPAPPSIAPPSSIVPPPFTFAFADQGTYRPTGAEHASGTERFYDYAYIPVGRTAAATREYHVIVEPSAAIARAMLARAVQTFTGAYQAIGVRKVDLAGTVLADPSLHAWTAEVPSLRCDIWAVFAYRNLWFLVPDSAHQNQDSCASKEQDTQSLELRLLQTARAYVRTRQS